MAGEARAGPAHRRKAFRASTRPERPSRRCASSRAPTSGVTLCASPRQATLLPPAGAPADGTIIRAPISLRHRHVPLHRRRGLDAVVARARRGAYADELASTAAPSARPRPPRRRRGRHAGRRVLRRVPDRAGCRSRRPALTEAHDAGPIRVRAGLHTGTPLLTDEGYVGDDVHRAARIAAAGHGGQVLVSSATATLVDGGAHRSRRAPLQGPGRAGAGLPARRRAVPRLKTLYRTNLPVPATPFLGREQELAEVAELLGSSARLVTLTGPGGTGKTRLALQAAADAAESFPDGICWVPLASLRDARSLLPRSHRRSRSRKSPAGIRRSVAARLSRKQALLILDNAEHLLPDFAAGIAASATSQARRARHEPRAPPAPGRARLRGPVTRGGGRCRALPYASASAGLRSRAPPGSSRALLAAGQPAAGARARGGPDRVFSPEQLLERLSQRLDLLKGGRDADPRQQTLRATIEWSYDLLEPEESASSARSPSSPGLHVEAAEAVCEADPDTLQSLLDKSLLRRREEEEARATGCWRRFASSRPSFRARPARTSRSGACMRALSRGRPVGEPRGGRRGGDAARSRHPRARQHAGGSRLGTRDRAKALGLELFVALENYWATAIRDDGQAWAKALLEGDPAVDPRLLSRALRVQGGMEDVLGMSTRTSTIGNEPSRIARELGDDASVAVLLHRLATAALRRGELSLVRDLAEESLAGHRRSGSPRGEAQALTSLADVAAAEGDLEAALEFLDESRRISDEVGFSWWLPGSSRESPCCPSVLGSSRTLARMHRPRFRSRRPSAIGGASSTSSVCSRTWVSGRETSDAPAPSGEPRKPRTSAHRWVAGSTQRRIPSDSPSTRTPSSSSGARPGSSYRSRRP